jgi:RNA polymerase sigma-70 factor (ECF subfamily)
LAAETTRRRSAVTEDGRPHETNLIGAARDGDLRAWELIVQRHQEAAFRVAYLVTRETHPAEEATRAAFVRAYRALPSLERTETFRAWLLRIASGEARARRREIGRQHVGTRPIQPLSGPRVAATPPTLSTSRRDDDGRMQPPSAAEREALTVAFDRLAEDDRIVVAARFLLGLTRSETAQLLGVAESTIDERLAHALDRLRLRLGGRPS